MKPVTKYSIVALATLAALGLACGIAYAWCNCQGAGDCGQEDCDCGCSPAECEGTCPGGGTCRTLPPVSALRATSSIRARVESALVA